MNASDIMQHHVITAETSERATHVAIRITVGKISGLPVTNPKNELVGIVTELDFIRALRGGTDLDATPVADLMTPEVITVGPETSVEQVMEILERERIIRVPVVSKGELVGIVSRSDVLGAALGPRLNLSEFSM